MVLFAVCYAKQAVSDKTTAHKTKTGCISRFLGAMFHYTNCSSVSTSLRLGQTGCSAEWPMAMMAETIC